MTMSRFRASLALLRMTGRALKLDSSPSAQNDTAVILNAVKDPATK